MIELMKRLPRYARRLLRDRHMRLYLANRIRTQAVVTVENFDFETTKRSILRFVESLRLGDEGHLYRYSLSCSAPTLYASAYACMTKSMLGALADLDPKTKSAWVAYFDSFQDSRDGLFYDPAVLNEMYAETDWWGARHLALHMISAYTDLDARPRHPFGFLTPYYDPGYLRSWLDQYSWHSAVIGRDDPDNMIMNIGCLLQYQRDTWNDDAAGAAVESLKACLREKINPATGMWGGFDVSDKSQRSRMVQFAYHLFVIFFFDREFDFDINRIVELVLLTQNRLGGFGVSLNSSACEDIDSIDLLLRLSEFTEPEVRDRAVQAVKRALSWVCFNKLETGGSVFRLYEPFVYGHLEMRASENQGALFSTWFRLLCVAMIVNRLGVPTFRLNAVPGYLAGAESCRC